MPKYHFAPSEEEMGALASQYNLDTFVTSLFSTLIHVLTLGVHFTNPAALQELDLRHEELLKKHIENAQKNDEGTDRLYPLRRTANSMKYVLQVLLPIPGLHTRLQVLQLLIWRVWGFGNVDRLKLLNFVSANTEVDNSDLVEAAHAAQEAGFAKDSVALEKFFDALIGLFNTFGKPENKKLQRTVYGQLMLERAKFREMLDALLHLSAEIMFKERPRSFKAVLELFDVKSPKGVLVHSVPKGGLLAWLIVSDLWEYNLCEGPTSHDLAEKVYGMPGSGPAKAFKIIEFLSRQKDTPKDTTEAYAQVLDQVMAVFDSIQTKSENGEEIAGLKSLYDILKQCEAAQGRRLGLVDIEHALCKIARERSEVWAAYQDTMNKGTKRYGEELSAEDGPERKRRRKSASGAKTKAMEKGKKDEEGRMKTKT